MPKRSGSSTAPALAPVNDPSGDEPTDDPVDAAMGDLDSLRDELGAFDVGADEEWEEPVLPPTFDVFDPRPESVRKIRETGRDPTAVKILAHPFRNGRRQKAIRAFLPEGVTYARLQSTLPPGRYDIVAYTEDNIWVGGKRITVSDRTDLEDLSGDADDFDAGGGRRRSSRSPGDQLVWQLAMRALKGHDSQGSSSEIREALAGMVKLQTLQLQMQQTELANRLKLFEAENRNRGGGAEEQFGLVTKILDVVDRRAGRGRNGKAPDASDFVGILQLGMHLAAAQNPSKDPPDNDWIERLFLPLVDQLGPGVVTLAAMLFPDDKAKPILEVLEQHMRTREAEAKAAAAEAEGPDVIDVEGESTE